MKRFPEVIEYKKWKKEVGFLRKERIEDYGFRLISEKECSVKNIDFDEMMKIWNMNCFVWKVKYNKWGEYQLFIYGRKIKI